MARIGRKHRLNKGSFLKSFLLAETTFSLHSLSAQRSSRFLSRCACSGIAACLLLCRPGSGAFRCRRVLVGSLAARTRRQCSSLHPISCIPFWSWRSPARRYRVAACQGRWAHRRQRLGRSPSQCHCQNVPPWSVGFRSEEFQFQHSGRCEQARLRRRLFPRARKLLPRHQYFLLGRNRLL